MELNVCPVCSSKLQPFNGAYICSNDRCDIVILDNHILTVDSITQLFEDKQTDKSGDAANETLDNTDSVKEKHVVVMNKIQAEEYAMHRHDETSIIISIVSKGSNEAFIVANKEAKIKDTLKLKFNDEDTSDENFGGISYMDAKQIATFVHQYKKDADVDSIIVQCEAGQSRSAGIAAAILKYLYDDDTQIFNNKKYTPNMLCYRRVLTALMYE